MGQGIYPVWFPSRTPLSPEHSNADDEINRMGPAEFSLPKYAVPVVSRLPGPSLTSDLPSHTHSLPSALEKDPGRKASPWKLSTGCDGA